MEPGHMNETRKLLSKFKQGRDDLNKVDGKTKQRVEDWNKNLKTLSQNQKKQKDIILGMNVEGSNNQGSSSSQKEFFGLLVSHL